MYTPKPRHGVRTRSRTLSIQCSTDSYGTIRLERGPHAPVIVAFPQQSRPRQTLCCQFFQQNQRRRSVRHIAAANRVVVIGKIPRHSDLYYRKKKSKQNYSVCVLHLNGVITAVQCGHKQKLIR